MYPTLSLAGSTWPSGPCCGGYFYGPGFSCYCTTILARDHSCSGLHGLGQASHGWHQASGSCTQGWTLYRDVHLGCRCCPTLFKSPDPHILHSSLGIIFQSSCSTCRRALSYGNLHHTSCMSLSYRVWWATFRSQKICGPAPMPTSFQGYHDPFNFHTISSAAAAPSSSVLPSSSSRTGPVRLQHDVSHRLNHSSQVGRPKNKKFTNSEWKLIYFGITHTHLGLDISRENFADLCGDYAPVAIAAWSNALSSINEESASPDPVVTTYMFQIPYSLPTPTPCGKRHISDNSTILLMPWSIALLP